MLPGLGAMMGKVAGVLRGTPDLTVVTNVSDTGSSGGTGSGTAYLNFSNLGVVQGDRENAGILFTGNWLSPQVGMSDFSVRWTNTSGTLSGGDAAGTWWPLSSARSFWVTRSTIGTKTCTGTVAIALTSDTGTILASKSVTLQAALTA